MIKGAGGKKGEGEEGRKERGREVEAEQGTGLASAAFFSLKGRNKK